ncbi:hypothetical protein EJB05_30594, partial [Eragrostis curvula]
MNKTTCPLKRNSADVGREYEVLIKPNDLNVVQCKLCPKIDQIAYCREEGEVHSCPNAIVEEDKAKCRKAIEESGRVKRAIGWRKNKTLEMLLSRAGRKFGSDLEPEENTGLEEIGVSGPRVMGHMENFTKSLDSCSLANEKKLHQPKFSEHVMKERLHRFKRYVSR